MYPLSCQDRMQPCRDVLRDHLLRQLLLEMRSVEIIAVQTQHWDIESQLDIHGLQATHHRRGDKTFRNVLNGDLLLREKHGDLEPPVRVVFHLQGWDVE